MDGMCSSTGALCTDFSLNHHLVYGTNLPGPVACTQQLTTAVAWYILNGATFRVPMSKLHKPKKQGGWRLLDIPVKCRAPTYVATEQEIGTATSTLFKAWGLVGPQTNPPNMGRIPKRLAYLQHFANGMAYIALQGQDETTKHFMRRMYDILQQLRRREDVRRNYRSSRCDRPLNGHGYGVMYTSHRYRKKSDPHDTP
jgi:hypothetical protein